MFAVWVLAVLGLICSWTASHQQDGFGRLGQNGGNRLSIGDNDRELISASSVAEIVSAFETLPRGPGYPK